MNLAVSKATPVILNATPYGAYFIFGSFNVVMAICAFWLPETKGVSSRFLLLFFLGNAFVSS